MNAPQGPLLGRVEALRQEFDRSFTVPPRERTEASEDFISIRVAGEAYALRLRDLAALAVPRKLVRLHSRRSEFLGLTGVRGSLVALFSLPLLLGYPESGPGPRWMALLASKVPLALGFDGCTGTIRASSRDLIGVGEAAPRKYVAHALRQEGVVRPVIDVQAIEAELRRQMQKPE